MTVYRGLWPRVEEHLGHTDVALTGELSLATAPLVRTVLGKALVGMESVLVDLSDLTLGQSAALEVFPAALATAGGWPRARLGLFGPTPPVLTALRTARIGRTVPIAVDGPAAQAALGRRPERVSRHQDLPVDASSCAAARLLVRAACADWAVDHHVLAATVVATELVANAVEHARTPCRITVGLDGWGLRISVRDGRPGPDPRPLPVSAVGAGARGLHLVSVFSSSWGTLPLPGGKTVWALIGAREGAQPSRSASTSDS